MKRLPAKRFLDRLIADNLVNDDDLREIARLIAAFHSSAQTSPAISAYGELDRIMFNWNENIEQIIPFEDSTLPATDREFIHNWVLRFAENNPDLFRQRLDNGFIRECDGDIHLGNICLDDGKTYIFDCIEFNERFRCCDTAADVAFLLMDLDYHGRRDLSETVISAYLEASGDRQMLQILDFYKIYRAFVRGKVESFRLNDNGIDHQERELAASRARKYFRLARGYIERYRLVPTLFITCGLMGCGKSTLAAQLSFELGIRSFNSDTVRKELSGISPLKPAPAPFGKGIYSRETSEETYNKLLHFAEDELNSGRSVIIDAGFPSKYYRSSFAAIAEKHSASLKIVYLFCSETENRRRLAERSNAGLNVSDGRETLLKEQQSVFEIPTEIEGSIITVNASKPVETIANQIYESIAR